MHARLVPISLSPGCCHRYCHVELPSPPSYVNVELKGDAADWPEGETLVPGRRVVPAGKSKKTLEYKCRSYWAATKGITVLYLEVHSVLPGWGPTGECSPARARARRPTVVSIPPRRGLLREC